LLGGTLVVHLDRARAVLEQTIAAPLGMSVLDAAAGIVDVVNAGMAAALRIVSVERGHDPREFTLVAFGGAGPVHAARLAQELSIPQVIVPPIPGGFSALGLVASDIRRDYVKTFYARLDGAEPARMESTYGAMESEARTMLAEAGVPEARREITRAADCRYGRQAYELTVPVMSGPIARATLDRLAADFHAKHGVTYGHASPDEPVQLVNLRVSALGRLGGLDLGRVTGATGPASAMPAGERQAYFKETGLVRCAVLPRDGLPPGFERPGPLIIEAMDTTIVVPPGWRCRADARGFITLEAMS
jgi:N-methylhydantoinase A